MSIIIINSLKHVLQFRVGPYIFPIVFTSIFGCPQIHLHIVNKDLLATNHTKTL
jgi:hypothetical protein